MLSLASKLRPLRAPVLRASFASGGFARSRKSQQINAVEAVERDELDLRRLAVIGGGNMAEAIITGVLTEGLIPSSKVVVSDPNPSIKKKYAQLNVETHTRNSSAVKDADVILVAVKPQVVDDVLRAVKAAMDPDALVISVVAGQSIKQLQKLLGQNSHIIRTMPNTPAMIGEGTTVWAQSAEVTTVQHELTKQILGSFGVEVFVDDENALDMATALSGSGPAYFFLVAEAMIDTGVHMGFSRPVATKLVQQTMLGSALYMQSEDVHPVELRNNITSPGGTTAAGLYRAEKNGFRAVIADSIWAAYERCLELGSSEPVQRQRPRSQSEKQPPTKWVVAPLPRAVAAAAARVAPVRAVAAEVAGVASRRPSARVATGAAAPVPVRGRATAGETAVAPVGTVETATGVAARARLTAVGADASPSASWCAIWRRRRRRTSCATPSPAVRATSWTFTSPRSSAPTSQEALRSSSSRTRRWDATSSSKWTANSWAGARSPCCSPNSPARVRRRCAASSTSREKDRRVAAPSPVRARAQAHRRDAVPVRTRSGRRLRVLHRPHAAILRRPRRRKPTLIAVRPLRPTKTMRRCLSELDTNAVSLQHLDP